MSTAKQQSTTTKKTEVSRPSSQIGENDNVSDLPTDEIQASVNQIKDDVQQQLHETEEQLQESVNNFKKDATYFLKNYKTEIGPLVQRQKAAGIQWWSDFSKQPLISRALLGGLFLTNFILPLMFLNYRESWIVMASYVLVSGLSQFFFQSTEKKSDRFTASLLSHLVWVPLLFWLGSRLSAYSTISKSASMENVDVVLTLLLSRGKYFSLWVESVIAMNSIVLFFDAIRMAKVLPTKLGMNKSIKSNKNKQGQQQQVKSLNTSNKQTLIDNQQDDNANRLKQRINTNNTPAVTA